MKFKVKVTRQEYAHIYVNADSDHEAKTKALDAALYYYENQCWETISLDATISVVAMERYIARLLPKE